MKEWYITASADDTGELFTSGLSSAVTLYRFDLSEQREVRCIVQGNVPDSQARSLERTFLFPTGTVQSGMYVRFHDSYWLITGYPGSNGLYEKVSAALCQYLLRWQDSSGGLQERWVHLSSAARFASGEKDGPAISLSSNKLTLLIPNDPQSQALEGKRVFIDKNDSHPTKVFQITKNDDVLWDYGVHGGILCLLAQKTEFNPAVDRLPEKPYSAVSSAASSDSITPSFSAAEHASDFSIVCNGSPTLIAGGNGKRFSILSNAPATLPHWTVTVLPEYRPYLSATQSDDGSILLQCAYSPKLTGASLLLTASADHRQASIPITIGGGI